MQITPRELIEAINIHGAVWDGCETIYSASSRNTAHLLVHARIDQMRVGIVIEYRMHDRIGRYYRTLRAPVALVLGGDLYLDDARYIDVASRISDALDRSTQSREDRLGWGVERHYAVYAALHSAPAARAA